MPPTKKKAQCTIGIDLGGTKVAAALVDFQGRVLGDARRPTVPPELLEQDLRKTQTAPSATQVRQHIKYVVEAMAEAVVEAIDQNSAARISGIGLASAGPMNIMKGTLDHPANFLGWKVVPLVKLLSAELAKRGLRKPVFFQNDATAAALGEGWVGSAKDCETYAMITVGTGIGTGVIFNGHPAQSQGMGSEWGHMLVDFKGLAKDPSSFLSREVEGVASGTGLIRRARERGFKGDTSAELARAARAGDTMALELFENAAEALASLLYSLSLGFHPEKIVISGGMLAIKELFLPQTIRIYREMIAVKNRAFLCPVQVAKLGIEAGVIGAARLPRLGLA